MTVCNILQDTIRRPAFVRQERKISRCNDLDYWIFTSDHDENPDNGFGLCCGNTRTLFQLLRTLALEGDLFALYLLYRALLSFCPDAPQDSVDPAQEEDEEPFESMWESIIRRQLQDEYGVDPTSDEVENAEATDSTQLLLSAAMDMTTTPSASAA